MKYTADKKFFIFLHFYINIENDWKLWDARNSGTVLMVSSEVLSNETF